MIDHPDYDIMWLSPQSGLDQIVDACTRLTKPMTSCVYLVGVEVWAVLREACVDQASGVPIGINIDDIPVWYARSWVGDRAWQISCVPFKKVRSSVEGLVIEG